MTAVPADMPLTTPVDAPTSATVVLLLIHMPPVAPSVNVIVEPLHTLDAPEIVPADGAGITVTVANAVQDPRVYVMVAVPLEIPSTTPVAEPMVATAGLLLLHVPPPTELVSVDELPIHTKLLDGVIVPGTGVTVIVLTAAQPFTVK